MKKKFRVSIFHVKGLIILLLILNTGFRGFAFHKGHDANSGVIPEKKFDNKLEGENTLMKKPYYWAWWGWEPLEHNIRIGGTSYTVDGSAWWIEQWYNRLHSEELVKKMADVGVNLAVTHFFKGFGLNFEHDQQKNTAQLVRFAHNHGLKVLGYCQLNSLYYETFLEEEPNAMDWVRRNKDGSIAYWNDEQYFRWSTCIHSPEFRSYLKKVIKIGLDDIKLDGFNFDNCSRTPCYCARCEAKFRDWLTEHYSEPRKMFGIESFNHVKQPPMPSLDEQINDPLVQSWIRWRCESFDGFVQEITDYVRSLNPDVILMANPGYPTSSNEPLTKSVWPWNIGKCLDLVLAENANTPGVDGDLLISQIRAFKQAEAIGYKVIPSTWAQGKGTIKTDASTRLPQTSTEVKLQIAEAAANGGISGANWATRALGGGNGMRIDLPDLNEALIQYLEFVQRNEHLLLSSQQVTDIAILHSFPSSAFNAQYSMNQTAIAEEILIRGGFSWGVVFDDEISQLDKYSALVLAGQTHLNDSTCTTINNFVLKGGLLILIGDNDLYNEQGKLLEKSRLDVASSKNVIRFSTLKASKVTDRKWGIFSNLPLNWEEVSQTIKESAGKHFSAHLTGDDKVTISAYKDNKSQLIIHLVNYGAPTKSTKLQIELGEEWKGKQSAQILIPGEEIKKFEIKQNGTRNFLEIPPLEVYGIIVIQ